MRRGGCVILQISELLHGEMFPDLSLSALGAWVRLRAAYELTGEPIGKRETDRLGLSAAILAELVDAHVAEDHAGALVAVGMPEPERYPSDDAAQTRERQEAHRLGITVKELRARKQIPPAPPVSSDQIRSGVTSHDVTSRDTETTTVSSKDDDDGAHDREYLSTHGLCRRCRQPANEDNPIAGAVHRFPDSCQRTIAPDQVSA